MTENQIQMIVSWLERIDGRVDRLAESTVSWKVLLALVGVITAIITTAVTVITTVVE